MVLLEVKGILSPSSILKTESSTLNTPFSLVCLHLEMIYVKKNRDGIVVEGTAKKSRNLKKCVYLSVGYDITNNCLWSRDKFRMFSHVDVISM